MSNPTESSSGETEPTVDRQGESDGDIEPIVPAPLRDETTVELVRDAIGVARGELSDERFAEKYGSASDRTDPEG